jgi:DNA-binding PadR family transcriptional regulator
VDHAAVSFAALAWAGKCKAGSASRKLVLMALADRHNEEANGSYPSISWLVGFTDLNRKTVINALTELEARGFISDSGDRRGDTRQIKLYRLHLETVPELEQSQKRNSSEKGAKQSQKRDTDTVRTRSKRDKPSSRARAKPKIPLPDGWEPKPLTAGSVCAGIVGLWQPGRIERELSKFRDHHLKTGAMWSDWDAAWRTWIQNSGEFERGQNGHQRQPVSLRGSRPDPALDLMRAGEAVIAAESAGRGDAPDRGAWLALSAGGAS